MMTLKNWGAFLVVGLGACRLMACSAKSSSALDPSGVGAGGFGNVPVGGSGPGAGPGLGGFVSSTGSTTGNGNNGPMFSLGGAATMRVGDAACNPIVEAPETITVTDSSVSPVAMFVMQDRSLSMIMGGNGASPQSWSNSTM